MFRRSGRSCATFLSSASSMTTCRAGGGRGIDAVARLKNRADLDVYPLSSKSREHLHACGSVHSNLAAQTGQGLADNATRNSAIQHNYDRSP